MEKYKNWVEGKPQNGVNITRVGIEILDDVDGLCYKCPHKKSAGWEGSIGPMSATTCKIV